MIDDQAVLNFHSALRESLLQVLQDVRFCMEKAMRDSADEEVKRIIERSQVKFRVKAPESIARKMRRDGLESAAELPAGIEDMLGIRVVTPDKIQARKLFEWFQHNQAQWFYDREGEVQFTPLTIQDRNKYSLRTGYQAFHLTFVAKRRFAWTPTCAWPCEVQLMAQVWEFWADYSRAYFYANADAANPGLLPYSAAISRLLDAADELMSETANILLAPAPAPPEPLAPAQVPPPEEVEARPSVTVDEVRSWLAANLRKYFGEGVRLPNDFFVHRIADELGLYGASTAKLDDLFSNKSLRAKYEELLAANRLKFLPVFQQVLCMLLLSQAESWEGVVNRMNSELRLQGVRLILPSEHPVE